MAATKKGGFSGNRSWYIRCLSVPGPDTDFALHIAFESVRFLYGGGEGLQRSCVQRGISMKYLQALLLPDGEQKSHAGLGGILMTAADIGLKDLSVIGPPATAHHIATMRSSVVRNNPKLELLSPITAAGSDRFYSLYTHPLVRISALSLRSPSSQNLPSLHSPLDPMSPDFKPNQLTPKDRYEWCKKVVGDMFRIATPHHTFDRTDGFTKASAADARFPLPPQSRQEVQTDLVYLFQATDLPGRFNVERSVQLGVPNGRLRSQLVKGYDIEVKDSQNPGQTKTVHPADVMEGAGPGSTLLIVSCGSNNLETLLASQAFGQYQISPNSLESAPSQAVHAVVHRSPKEVWTDARYQLWMSSFGPNTQHLIASTSPRSQQISFTSAAWHALYLSRLDSNIFHVPFQASTSLDVPNTLPPNSSFLDQNLELKMQPPSPATMQARHERDHAFPETAAGMDRARQNASQISPNYTKKVDAARRAVRADARWTTPQDNFVGHDITVTTLGTGSSIPSLHRNVSATHLDIPNMGGVLLDCGENTIGQLHRRYGPNGMEALYRNLRMIFISHMHADHHLGLHTVLEDRFEHGITSKLYLVAPWAIALSLQESGSWQHHASQEALDNIVWLSTGVLRLQEAKSETPERDTHEIDEPVDPDFTAGIQRWPRKSIIYPGPDQEEHSVRTAQMMIRELGLTTLAVPPMRHRGKAWGLALTHRSGWKIAYSGDTQPCEGLIKAGENATLVIHEATLEDDKHVIAAEKGHSTFSQAIDVGMRMNASHILLSHFSQRYPKMPPIVHRPDTSKGDASQPVISISFDLMSVRIGEMWKMGYYMDALQTLQDEMEQDDGTDVALPVVERKVRTTEHEDGNVVERKRDRKGSLRRAKRTQSDHDGGEEEGNGQKRRERRDASGGGRTEPARPDAGLIGDSQ